MYYTQMLHIDVTHNMMQITESIPAIKCKSTVILFLWENMSLNEEIIMGNNWVIFTSWSMNGGMVNGLDLISNLCISLWIQIPPLMVIARFSMFPVSWQSESCCAGENLQYLIKKYMIV